MELYYKFIIILIVVITSYLLYRLFQRRQIIFNTKDEDIATIVDGFISGNSNKPVVVEGMRSNKLGKTVPPNDDFPLMQYCFMASYNSAYAGPTKNTISNEAVNHILSLGCRWLDFEVYLIGGKPMVAVSNDPVYSSIKSIDNMGLYDILTNVTTTAMNPEKCPNAGDPVFINLRIKSQNTDIYALTTVMIDKTVGTDGGSKLYKGRIDNLKSIDELMGKFVIIIDKTANADWANYPNCDSDTQNCHKLKPYVNMESGTDNLRLSTYNKILDSETAIPHIFDDELYTDVAKFQHVTPSDYNTNTANPAHSTFVLNYGTQIVAYPFYNDDKNLKIYIKAFNDNGAAMVPISTMIKYYKKAFDTKMNN